MFFAFCPLFLSVFFFFFLNCRVEFVFECERQQSLSLCAVRFQSAEKHGFILFYLQICYIFSLAVFCVKFTETLASCSSKVMCLQGCVSLSPDCIYHSVVCMCKYSAEYSVYFGHVSTIFPTGLRWHMLFGFVDFLYQWNRLSPKGRNVLHE